MRDIVQYLSLYKTKLLGLPDRSWMRHDQPEPAG